MEKRDFNTEKLYYGFPVVILGYKDENCGYNISTISSSYSLGNTLVIGIWNKSNSTSNIKKFGEFTVNIPEKEIMELAEAAGSVSTINKLEKFNVDYTISKNVDAPILNSCSIVLECIVKEVVELGGIPILYARLKIEY